MTPQRLALCLSALLFAVLAVPPSGCGSSVGVVSDAAIVEALDVPTPPDAQAPEPPDAAAPGPDAAPLPIWQVAVASPLLAPEDPDFPVTFSGPTTFRVPFTNLRSGTKVQLAFRGDSAGAMTLTSAWIGRYLGSGTVENNTQLHFGGQPGASVAPDAVAISDPLDFAVASGERYAVSFVASGTVPHALSDLNFEGLMVGGSQADRATLSGATIDQNHRGVKWVAVFGLPTRAVCVLGDSIGAGEASWGTDMRFIDRAQIALGYPVVDSSMGGDGVTTAYARIERDVLPLPGITDCLVEIGTNDLWQANDEKMGLDAGTQFIIDGLTSLYTRLRSAGLRPWGATILPKGLMEDGRTPNLTANGEAARVEVNKFILSTPLVAGVADFAGVVADPADSSKPAEGMLSRDGIHPLNEGHQAMADEMVRVLQATPATP